MQLYVVHIEKSQLELIPEDERIFFILSGNLFNEINILQKMAIFSYKDPSGNEAIERSHIYQTLFFIKLLAGKVWEGWELIRNCFFNKNFSREYSKLLSNSGSSGLTELKRYFGRRNLLKDIRNFIFHYSIIEIRQIFEEMPDKTKLEFYFEEGYINNFYYGSELLMNYEMLRMIDPTNKERAIATLMDETIMVTRWLMDFIGNCMPLFVKKYLINNDGELHLSSIELGQVPSIDDVAIPYFVVRKNI